MAIDVVMVVMVNAGVSLRREPLSNVRNLFTRIEKAAAEKFVGRRLPLG